MTDKQQPAPVPARPATILRAQAIWITLCVILSLAGAFAYLQMAPVRYLSEVTVVLEVQVSPGTTPVPPAMGTEKRVAASGLVLDRAAAALGTSSGVLDEQIDVSVPPDSNLLAIDCTAATPEAARGCAQAVAEAYVVHRNQGVRGGPAANLRASIVTDAGLPGAPKGHSAATTLGLAAAAGLALGLLLAFARELAGDQVRGRADLLRFGGVQTLAEIPRARRRFAPGRRLRGGAGQGAAGPAGAVCVVRSEPAGRAAESYRFLKVRLEVRTGDLAGRIVMVTAPRSGARRPTTALNLAAAIAEGGEPVVLVDADLDAPMLSRNLGGVRVAGLRDVLAGTVQPDQVLLPTEVPGVRLLGAGSSPVALQTRVDARQVAPVLRSLAGDGAVVVVDAGAVLGSSDTLAMVGAGDLVLLVVSARRTRRQDVARACEELAAAGIPQPLAVLEDVVGRGGATGAAMPIVRGPVPIARGPVPIVRGPMPERPSGEGARTSGPGTADPGTPDPGPVRYPEPPVPTRTIDRVNGSAAWASRLKPATTRAIELRRQDP